MLNTAIIMGRLTADPELRTTQSGISVTSFTVAVDRAYKSGDERQTDFINVVAWRGTADFVSRYFSKGQMIAVQGSIQTRNYEKADGTKGFSVDIVADEVEFLSSRNDGSSDAGSEGNMGGGAPVGGLQPIDDDNLPF